MAKEKEKPGETLIVRNRRARFEYELGETFEAGVVLMGSEIKMLRQGKADLGDSWCAVEQGEAWLKGVNVPILTGAAFGHEAKRARKLLLHRNEIEQIERALTRDGMTVAATRLYFKDGRVKVEIALAKGKKEYDKRQTLREKQDRRETDRAVSAARRRQRA